MSSSRFATFLYVLTIVALVQIGLGVDPLFYICSDSGNITSDSAYAGRLDTLMTNLYFKTPPTGFAIDSVGPYSDRANGIALCRGDVSYKDCKACVGNASNEIRNHCPYNKGAIIWYEYCLLKYSNNEFFGIFYNQNQFSMLNVQNVRDPKLFDEKTKDLLVRLAEKAYFRPKMYAKGESEFGNSTRIYGLVQCTRDLSSVDCKKCLDDAISELPSCCDGKQGGRVVGGSCNVRYEIYPFFLN